MKIPVNVTLDEEDLKEIDRRFRNRSEFIRQAVKQKLSTFDDTEIKYLEEDIVDRQQRLHDLRKAAAQKNYEHACDIVDNAFSGIEYAIRFKGRPSYSSPEAMFQDLHDHKMLETLNEAQLETLQKHIREKWQKEFGENAERGRRQ